MRNFYKFTCVFLLSLCAKAQVPTATITSINNFCTSRTLTFTANSHDTITAYSWSITPSKTVTFTTGTTDSIVSFQTTNAGTYSLTVTISNPAGTKIISKLVNVTRSAKALFNASLSNQGFPAQLLLTNYSTNSTKNYWVFDGNFADKDSSGIFSKTYTASGSYSVMLIAKGPNGCDDINYYSFRIADSSGISLPNVFSPNGDGINDVFKPIAKGMRSVSAWIYSRSGVVIASWENRVNGFWDGHTTGGEPCISGEYFVVVEATGFDGKKYKLKGNITLLR